MNVAIVGATGNVGRKTLEVLEKKNLPIKELYLVASPRSVGQKVLFKSKEHEVFNLETFDFSKVQITFFAAGGKISENFAEKAAKHSIVIDNSSFFRMDPEVPLIVPQVNAEAIKTMKKTTLTIILTSILAFSVSFGQERPRLVKLIVAKAIKEKVSSGDILRLDRPELSDEAKDQLSELKGKKDALRAELKENISKLGEGATKEEIKEATQAFKQANQDRFDEIKESHEAIELINF